MLIQWLPIGTCGIESISKLHLGAITTISIIECPPFLFYLIARETQTRSFTTLTFDAQKYLERRYQPREEALGIEANPDTSKVTWNMLRDHKYIPSTISRNLMKAMGACTQRYSNLCLE